MVERRLPEDCNSIESNIEKRTSVQSTKNLASRISKFCDEVLKKHISEASPEKLILGRIERLHWIALAFAVAVTVFAEMIAKTHRVLPEVDSYSCMFDYDYSILCAALLLVFLCLGSFTIIIIANTNTRKFIVWDLGASLVLGSAVAILTTIFMSQPVELGLSADICLTCVTVIGHMTAIVGPVVISYKNDMIQQRRMSVNLVSFGEVLDTESLFESFKQVALQNMAVEECLFWEAYKVGSL
ncbi:hypothetical protein HDU84_003442 [Entophlyctis sp. JEL0112]|nr:hypothetical protein HDU84_003442 [Entophlyctis sp. JEL0112]